VEPTNWTRGGWLGGDRPTRWCPPPTKMRISRPGLGTPASSSNQNAHLGTGSGHQVDCPGVFADRNAYLVVRTPQADWAEEPRRACHHWASATPIPHPGEESAGERHSVGPGA
jgi:hypothetical protein